MVTSTWGGTAAWVVVVLVASGATMGAASPPRGDGPDKEVYTGSGWGPDGHHDITVTQTTDENGDGSATVSGGAVSTLSPAVARRQARAAAAEGPQPEVTHADLAAWVHDLPDSGEVDEGPQPDSDGVVTYSQVGTGKSSSPGVMSGDESVNGGLPAYDCATISASDDDVHARVCTDYVFKSKGNGHTYFTADGIGSAWSTDIGCLDCDRLTGFGGWNDLTDGVGAVYKWAPTSTKDVGSCSDKTAATSATIGGTTISASETQEVCPDKWGVYTDKLTASSSGALWVAGPPPGYKEARGTHFVQIVDWDRSHTLYLASHAYVAWD